MGTLLEQIAAGNDEAVAACVDAYGGLVWRLARRYLNRADAFVDDAVQEVFLEVWLSAHRFDPDRGSEVSFVATIAHRRLIDAQRRVTLQRSTDRRAVEASMPPVMRERLPGRDAEWLADEFDRLPEDERQALWLSIHGGLTHRQISDVTAAPIGTVKTRLRRGLLRLHDTLARVMQGSGVDA